MQPLQRLFDSDGNEVVLFPMEYLYLSQGEHQQLALDFLGWNSLGRVYNCPCYAPISCRVVYTGNDHNMICWSLNPVRLADGSVSNISILVAHSETPPSSVGTVIQQGQLWYHSGNYGHSTGDHLHMEVAKGHVTWDGTGLHLDNPEHLYNVMAINDTTLVNDMGFNWQEYDGITPTPTNKKKKVYNFVLFNRKRRRYLNG